jgi:hypothetical protein
MKIRKRKIIYLILFISIIILLFNSFKGPSISYDEDIILKNESSILQKYAMKTIVNTIQIEFILIM